MLLLRFDLQFINIQKKNVKTNILVNSGIAHLHKYTQTHKKTPSHEFNLSLNHMLCSNLTDKMALYNAYHYENTTVISSLY